MESHHLSNILVFIFCLFANSFSEECFFFLFFFYYYLHAVKINNAFWTHTMRINSHGLLYNALIFGCTSNKYGVDFTTLVSIWIKTHQKVPAFITSLLWLYFLLIHTIFYNSSVLSNKYVSFTIRYNMCWYLVVYNDVN